ncbi:MAG: TolC family protein [Fulvivirga sp.]|nr:TolC family protein [Fulvivirga sp.]
MRRILDRSIKVIVALFCVLQLNAQEVGGTLTFSEAVKIALENNVTIKRQENQQYVNQAQKTSSMASMAPQITAFAQGWKTQGNQFIEQEARVVNDAETTNFFGTVDASMPLFNGFNRINQIKQANINLEAQQHLVNQTRQDVITDVANQYLQCLLDIELLNIAKENLQSQKIQLEQIEIMVQEGSRAKVDEYNQESIVKTAEVTTLRAEITLRNDLAILSRTLQLDPTVSFKVEEPSWSIEEMQFESRDLENLYEIAKTNRNDLLQAQKNVSSNKKGMAIARSAYVPTLSAFASINSRYSDASIPAFEDQMNSNLRKAYGLRLNIPIFNGLQNRTSFVQSKVDYENAQLTLENLENVVKTDVLSAYQNYQDAIKNYEASEASYESAEIALKLERERYNLKASDLVQLTTAQQRFIEAQSNLAQARYTLLFQDILLQYAVGTLKFEDIP